MIWNYHDADAAAPSVNVKWEATGLPSGLERMLLKQYRIDERYSDAFSAWVKAGSPQSPTAEQYRALEAAGQLQMFDSPHWVPVTGGRVQLNFDLPRQAVGLIELSW
jgi:xylan 1,4-beta-xylosidase